jgi:hypothetical protein
VTRWRRASPATLGPDHHRSAQRGRGRGAKGLTTSRPLPPTHSVVAAGLRVSLPCRNRPARSPPPPTLLACPGSTRSSGVWATGVVMVRVRVTAAPGPRSTDLTRLYNWFRDDREVAQDAEIALSGAATPGAMGTGEVIDMVVGHALTLTSIANRLCQLPARPAEQPAGDVPGRLRPGGGAARRPGCGGETAAGRDHRPG